MEFHNVRLTNATGSLYLLCYNTRHVGLNNSRLPVVAHLEDGASIGPPPLSQLNMRTMLPRTTLSLRLYSTTNTPFDMSTMTISFMLLYYR